MPTTPPWSSSPSCARSCRPSRGTIATSGDGKTWTSQTRWFAESFRGVAYGNGTFVAVGVLHGTIVTSLDGRTWTERASGVKARALVPDSAPLATALAQAYLQAGRADAAAQFDGGQGQQVVGHGVFTPA